MKFKIKPFLELARFHQPAGWLLLMWPCLFGTILAGADYSINYYFMFLFALGSICLRGAGCVVNDIIDKDIDAQVERTKNRPLASDALKPKHAIILLVLLLIGGGFVFLKLNTQAKMFSVMAAVLAIIYPYMKRIFGYPQLFLGIVFNSGVIVAWNQIVGNLISKPCALLYAGCIFWTLAYDTIYGHMDKKDDERIGVRSTSISFGKYNRIVITGFYIAFYALVCNSAYMIGAVKPWKFLAPALVSSLYIALSVKFDDPQDCMKKFQDNAFITGFLYFAGLYIDIILS